MKIVSVVGARPQFIKAAAVNRAISEKHMIVHTGQHYDDNMSDIFFREMKIPVPDYNLGIGNCSHGAMTGRMMEALEKVLLKENPNWVIVYGDTNSTLAGALVAAKLHIPVAHVEAGLRSFNRKMSEEINRIVADHCSDLLFSSSEVSTNQLLKEGIPKHKIVQSGDVMLDSLLYYREEASEKGRIFSKLRVQPKKYILATIHRAENTDDPIRLNEIFAGLNLIAEHIPVIVPLHPRTKKELERCQLTKSAKNMRLIDPISYLDMIALESCAQSIFTDSGGIQKEAYFFKTPCFTLRDETEWIELVEHGFNRLVQAKRDEILNQFLTSTSLSPNWDTRLYGEGNAAQVIAKTLTTITCHL